MNRIVVISLVVVLTCLIHIQPAGAVLPEFINWLADDHRLIARNGHRLLHELTFEVRDDDEKE